MDKWVRKIILVSILFAVTQIFEIIPLGLSVYQVVLFITGGVSIIGLIYKGRVLNGIYIWFAIINFVSALIAYNTSLNRSWAKSYFLLAIMMSMYVVLIPNFFNVNDICLLEKTMIRSQYLTIIMSLYSFYLFYWKGGMPETIKLFGIFQVTLDENAIARMQISQRLRLMLPYATPSVLSAVMGICILLLLYNKSLYKTAVRWGLIIIFSVILIFTGSRTGIAGIAVVILFRSMREILHSGKTAVRYMALGIPLLFIILAFLSGSSNLTYVNKLIISRFADINLLSDRHFLVPIEGILIWTNSVRNFIVGIGFGSSLFMNGIYTELPPYFLNSFVTFLAERGLLGLIMDIILIVLAFVDKRKAINIRDHKSSLVTAYRFIVISNLFYELMNCYFVIIVIACCFILERNHENNISYHSRV